MLTTIDKKLKALPVFAVKTLKECKNCGIIALNTHFKNIKCKNVSKFSHSETSYEEGWVFTAKENETINSNDDHVVGVSAGAGFFGGLAGLGGGGVGAAALADGLAVGTNSAVSIVYGGMAVGSFAGIAAVGGLTYGAACLTDKATKKAHCSNCKQLLNTTGCMRIETSEYMEHDIV